MSRWLIAGLDDAAILADGDWAGSVPLEVVTAGSIDALADAVADALEPGDAGVVAAGGDPVVHAAVTGMRRALASAAFPAQRLWLPEDPFNAGDDPIRLRLAFASLGSTRRAGLATTIGARSVPGSLGLERAWGRLDVATGRIVDASGAEREVVVSTGLRTGFDLEPRHRRWRAAPTSLTVTLGGRRAKPPAAPTIAHEVVESFAFVSAMNAQHCAWGRVAPRAVPHDGHFDVALGRGDARDLTAWLRRMPRGDHLPDAGIEEWLCDELAIDAGDAIVTLDLDGIRMRVRRLELRVERSEIALAL